LGFNLRGFAPTSRRNTTTTVLKAKKKSICMNVCIPGDCWQQAGRQELEEMQQHLGFGDTVWNNGV